MYAGADNSFIPCNNINNDMNLTCSLPKKYTCDSITQCVGNGDESKEICGNMTRYSNTLTASPVKAVKLLTQLAAKMFNIYNGGSPCWWELPCTLQLEFISGLK